MGFAFHIETFLLSKFCLNFIARRDGIKKIIKTLKINSDDKDTTMNKLKNGMGVLQMFS